MMMHVVFNIDYLQSLDDKTLMEAVQIQSDGVWTITDVRKTLALMRQGGRLFVPPTACDNYDEQGKCRGHGNHRLEIQANI
jgi:hypothetical protein